MSLISDALFLEATAADASRRRPVDTAGSASQVDVEQELELADIADFETPAVSPEEQAHAIAEWIYAGPIGRGSKAMPRSPASAG